MLRITEELQDTTLILRLFCNPQHVDQAELCVLIHELGFTPSSPPPVSDMEAKLYRPAPAGPDRSHRLHFVGGAHRPRGASKVQGA